MSNFAQKTVVISFMTTKKYIWAYFRRKSMDLGQKKYTSQIEVSRSTPGYVVFRGGTDTSTLEVYFFRPKSILFLLKYAKIYFFVVIKYMTTEY